MWHLARQMRFLCTVRNGRQATFVPAAGAAKLPKEPRLRFSVGLIRRLWSGRCQPGVDLHCDLALLRPAQEFVALSAWGQHVGALARLRRRPDEALFE